MKLLAYFHIKPEKAAKIIQEIVSTVAEWRTVAKTLHLSNSEQEKMLSAFRFS